MLKITEEQINQVFLELIPIDDEDYQYYKENGIIIIHPDDTKRIQNNMRIEGLNEPIFRIIRRGIDETIPDPYEMYPLPPKMKAVKNNKT